MENSVETYLLFLFFFLAFGAPVGLVGWYYDILTSTLAGALVVGFPVGGALIVLVASFLFPAAGTWQDENENSALK
jgi:hypothetical protein